MKQKQKKKNAGEIDAGLIDIGNGQILAGLAHGYLLWVVDHKRWMHWDGERWAHDREQLQVTRLAQKIRDQLDEQITIEPLRARRDQLRAQQERASTISGIRAAIELARPALAVYDRDLDRDPDLLAVQGAYVSLRSGEHVAPSSGSRVTKIAGAFVPDGTPEHPHWTAFLEETFRDPELIAFVRRAIGYSLTGHVGERCIFVCHGQGANGKSTLMRVLAGLAGEYAMGASPELLVNRKQGINNDVARLKGARCVIMSEPDEGCELAEGLVKELTGGDLITARFLYGEYFDFRPEAKFWMTTNHRPVIRGSDDAVWDRVRLIPFDNVVAKERRDPLLISRLMGELPDILAWAIEGATEWYAEGLGATARVAEATTGYRHEMDQVATFLEDCTQSSQYGRIEATLLYQHYRDWSKRMGEESMPQREFGRRMTMRGTKRKRGSTGRWVYTGVIMKADHGAAEEED